MGVPLALTLPLGACSKPSPTLNGPESRLADYGLALRFPADWQVRENDASLRLLARPLRKGRPVPGVWFIVSRDRARNAPAGFAETLPSLQSYVERRESLAHKDVLDYRVIAGGQLLLDGIAGVRRERAYASYSQQVRAYVAMVVRGRYGYELTGAAPAADYSEWQPAFAAVAGSLHWLPEPADASTDGATP